MSPAPGGRMGAAFLTEEEKQSRPKLSPALLKRVFSYLLPYWKYLLIVLLAILASSVFSLFPAILTGKIIDVGLIGRDFHALVFFITAAFLVLVASNLIDIIKSYLNTWMAQHITFDMRNKMFRHLQSMSHGFFTTNKQGDIITRMTSDISGVENVLANTLTEIISNVAVVATSLFAMYQKNWILATIGLVIVPLFVLPTKRVGKKRWEITLQSQACNDEINQILNETLSVSGQLLVKLFGKEDSEYEKYARANRKMINLNIRESMAGRWFRATLSIFTEMGPILIYLAAGIIIILRGSTTLSVGDVTVMVTLLSRMYRPVSSLLNIQVDVIRSMALFTRIFSYFDIAPEITSPVHPFPLPEVRGEIQFRDVSFAYTAEHPILRDINFTVAPGQSVAIVGPSGAGKSTITNLIPRIFDVDAGAVLLDGHDIRSLDLALLRRSIGVVTQDTYLFNGTIRENLLYANPDASETDLLTACRKANIHDYIVSLPDGYDSVVGNRGLKLSGGEKQRISIARIILKNPKILIFDEATSSLDSISEHLIQDAIAPLLQEHTSIMVAHRLSTIMAADFILVVKDGQIVERGRHADLLEQGGVYTKLYETQFSTPESAAS